MAINRLSFLIFFIPIVIGINTTVSKVGTAANNSVNVTHTHNATLTLPKVVNNSAGDLSIMTEGGSIGAKQTIATAAKGTSKADGTTLLTKIKSDPLLDIKSATLIGTPSDPLDIPVKNTGKSVVGRKGVNFKEEEDSANESKLPNAPEVKDVSNKAPELNVKTELTSKATTNTVHLQPKKTEPTPVPHKPTLLSYGALESSDDKTLSLIEEGLKLKQAPNPGSHPGMITPVVITVLVVPMFAVLGYLALKRGKEAWKNRHYKRMDFLLDGMYND